MSSILASIVSIYLHLNCIGQTYTSSVFAPHVEQ